MRNQFNKLYKVDNLQTTNTQLYMFKQNICILKRATHKENFYFGWKIYQQIRFFMELKKVKEAILNVWSDDYLTQICVLLVGNGCSNV